MATLSILGWVLIVLGVVFIIFALLDLLKKLPADKPTQGGTVVAEGGFVSTIVDLVKAIGTFLEQLTKAPRWLTLFALGVILIGLGIWLVLGLPGANPQGQTSSLQLLLVA
jgi:hypothetical protein